MKIAKVEHKRLVGCSEFWRVSVGDLVLAEVATSDLGERYAKSFDMTIAPLFLRFGSLVREEAAKKAGEFVPNIKIGEDALEELRQDNSDHIRHSLDDQSLMALLEKMGEGV
jgi:hypothetical protein